MRISDWSSDVCSSDLGTAEDYTRSHTRKVADVMTADVVSVTEDQPVAVVVKLMEKHRIKRVPVVRGGKVIGLVSRADMLRAFACAVADRKSVGEGKSVRGRVRIGGGGMYLKKKQK